ncbi:KR domain-containing protein [Nocardia sp. NPDC003482]
MVLDQRPARRLPTIAYAAANATRQALAHDRRRRGEPALCADWGSMSGGGMAEADADTIRYLDAVGLRPIPMDTSGGYLAECLCLDIAHATIADIDWAKVMVTVLAVARSSRFADFATGSNSHHVTGVLPARGRLAHTTRGSAIHDTDSCARGDSCPNRVVRVTRGGGRSCLS